MSLIDSQIAVVVSTLVIFLLTLVLAVVITLRYLKKKSTSLMYWSAGLWTFAAGVLIEIFFALNVDSHFLIDLYLFLVVILVEFLALGSVHLLKSKRIIRYYTYFAIFAAILTLYTVIATQSSNIVINYVAAGLPSLDVIISSTIATSVAAAIIVIIAVMSFIKKRNTKLLSIIIGVIVVSIAGSLYIASFPEFLYYSEFIGILLLWWGFI